VWDIRSPKLRPKIGLNCVTGDCWEPRPTETNTFCSHKESGSRYPDQVKFSKIILPLSGPCELPKKHAVAFLITIKNQDALWVNYQKNILLLSGSCPKKSRCRYLDHVSVQIIILPPSRPCQILLKTRHLVAKTCNLWHFSNNQAPVIRPLEKIPSGATNAILKKIRQNVLSSITFSLVSWLLLSLLLIFIQYLIIIWFPERSLLSSSVYSRPSSSFFLFCLVMDLLLLTFPLMLDPCTPPVFLSPWTLSFFNIINSSHLNFLHHFIWPWSD